MTATIFRLAFGGIRSRVLASILTLLISAAAVATIVLALEVGSTGVEPWQRTFDEAHGAHVLALAPSEKAAEAVASLPGVVERGDPLPQTTATMTRPNGEPVQVVLAGLDGVPRVNAPVPIAGSMAGSDGVVLEHSFAEALGLETGDTVEMTATDGSSVSLPIVGAAVLPSQPRYPRNNPGVAWTTRDVLEKVQPDSSRWVWTEAVRLADPDQSKAFTDQAATLLPPSLQEGLSLETWQHQRAAALEDARPTSLVLTMFTILLLAVALTVTAILSAARASTQHREIGLLKAVGLTPRQVAAVFIVESACLGLAAVAVGFALGATLAPRLAAASAATGVTLVGAPSIAASAWHAIVAAVIVVPLLILSTFLSTRRTTRFSVLTAMRSGAVLPSRSRSGRGLARFPLPVAVSVGLKDLAARRRRAFWLGIEIWITGGVLVITLLIQSALGQPVAGGVSDIPAGLPALIYTLDAVLVLMAGTALVAIALLSVRERVRDIGLLQAIGLTPRQISLGFTASYSALAVIPAVLAIPLGIAGYLFLYWVASGSSPDQFTVSPSLALVPIGVIIFVALATAIPARAAAKVRIAAALRYE